MVNILSIICFSTLFVANLAFAASADLRARHAHLAHMEAYQNRAAEDHRALVAERRSGPPPARKRANGRCSSRTTSTSVLSVATSTTSKFTTTTTSVAPKTTTKTTTKAPGNPVGTPSTTKKTSTTTSHAHKTTTTKKAVKEETSTTKKAVTTTKASSGGGGGGSGTTYSGDGTYYGTGLGSCGWTNEDTDYIAAVSHILYDGWPGATANPNDNPICGRYATAHYGGNSVRVKIVDRCTGCAKYDLDFSPSAFSQLADQSLGRIKITWQWD